MCCAKNLLLHRFIMGNPKGMDVDHWDRNPLNNRRNNLRIASRTQNNMNAKVRSNSKTGFKGVNARRGGYQTRIKVEGKYTYLGSSNDVRVAAQLYDKAAIKYFGEFALTNERLGKL